MPYLVGQNERRSVFTETNRTLNNLAAVIGKIIGNGSNKQEGSTSLRNTLTSGLRIGFTGSRNLRDGIDNSNSHKITTLPKYCKYMIPDKGSKVNKNLADI
jgi:hypothetical protein